MNMARSVLGDKKRLWRAIYTFGAVSHGQCMYADPSSLLDNIIASYQTASTLLGDG